MLITISLRVSAIYSILFTCFFITFNAHAQVANEELRINKSHALLESQVLHHMQQHYANIYNNNDEIRINVRNIDSRITISQCDQPYSFEINQQSPSQSNVSIKVTCTNTNWYLFMHANVAVIQEVVVSKDNLSPGSLLSSRNLEVIEVDKNKLRGSTFASIDEISGARIKRRIRSGNIIDGRMLCFICKGDRVTIAAVSGGLSIKVYGVAEEDGILGDTIQVRNISSDKLILGKIASTTQVEISI